ncbi:MAG: hypothetical protein KDD46_00195 [Bdellovibrionales bacterium]|nr:hypothetical protein [Bdellovibrionales bacterium]
MKLWIVGLVLVVSSNVFAENRLWQCKGFVKIDGETKLEFLHDRRLFSNTHEAYNACLTAMYLDSLLRFDLSYKGQSVKCTLSADGVYEDTESNARYTYTVTNMTADACIQKAYRYSTKGFTRSWNGKVRKVDVDELSMKMEFLEESIEAFIAVDEVK